MMVDVPKPWKDVWNQWDIRVFVLTSLFLQMLLIIFSSRRRRNASKTFSLFIWSIYLLADWVAAFALGLLSNSQGKSDDCETNIHMGGSNKINSKNYDDKLLALWAPFLLLHLGGPDTITAFAMEDNELWPRHLLGLVFELGAAVYVFLLSIPKNTLLVPTLLMFLAGIIKYGERTYALYLASLDGFRDSMLKEPDPGPNYAKLMEDYASKKDSGIPAIIQIIPEPEEVADTGKGVEDASETDVQKVREAHKFFNKFKGLIVELIFSFHDRYESRTAFLKKPAKEAYRVVEFELNFIYDVLFTKAVVVHHRYGYILRAVCSCSIMGAFVSFFLSEENNISELDKAITYILLGGAIGLDAWAFVVVILSDWTVVNLGNPRFDKIISSFFDNVRPCNRWSVKLTQHNLINYCIPDHPTYCGRIRDRPTFLGKVDELLCIQRILRWTGIGTKLLDESLYTWREDVTEKLKEFVFEELKKKASNTNDLKETRRMCLSRGSWALEERGYLREFGYSVEVELDESLLMWHIATDLCYYTEENEDKEKPQVVISKEAANHRRFCKLISDYMVYLLVMRPFMMSSAAVIGQIRYRDTCAETKNFFLGRPLEDENKMEDKTDTLASKTKRREEMDRMHREIGCRNLLSVNTEVKPIQVKGDRSKSVLFDACILAKELKKLEVTKRWNLMSEVWTEMLAYTASSCPGIAHAQRLSKGGEFLTFVWFLMTHLGLGEQYRIEAGHARAKLIVDK